MVRARSALPTESRRRRAVIPFTPPALATVPPPKLGAPFKLTGYESGAFTGIPDAALQINPAVASTGFAWTPSFEILRVEN